MYFCDKCGTTLVEDPYITSLEYNKVIKGIISKDGEIIKENLPTFVTYSCRRCGSTKNVEISEILKEMMQPSIEAMLDTRLAAVFEATDRSTIDEANGISYCGICPGVLDDTGYCYNDLIKQCVVRKVVLGL